MDGEVDELVEDVGWSISCLEGVMCVEEGKLEEELVDKPRTTIGTKFSVLHCIRIPFSMRCGFDHWSIHRSIRVHRKAFPAIELLAYPRGLSVSRIHPILWHTQLPLHAFALHHWLLWLSLDFSTSSRFPIQRNQILFADHVHRRSGVHNKFSFLWFKGRHQFSEGEKNAVLFFSFD